MAKMINGVVTKHTNGHIVSDDLPPHVVFKNNNNHHKKIDAKNYDDIVNLTNYIRSLVDIKEVPKVGIICGSGLGGLGDAILDAQILPYSKIPGFPITTVGGHKGNIVFGYLGGKYVVCVQGRFHPYEHNMDLALCVVPVRIMHLLGVETLIVSNAAGGINPKHHIGDLMIIKDHIFMPGLCGFSPLVGINDPRFGPRFVSTHDVYDKDLRSRAHEIAKKQKIRVQEGIYVMSGGPQYESPAEANLYRMMGADALGMSTCHEVTVARQCSIRVFGFSLITNIAPSDADISQPTCHEEVLTSGKEASSRACKFVTEIIKSL